MAKDEKKLHSFTSFNSGEYSPELSGRVDIESFGSSARFLSNFMSQSAGGLKKFYGTTHVAEVMPNSGRRNVRLVPFINNYEPMSFVFWGIEDPATDDGSSIQVGLIYGDKYKSLDINFPSSVDVWEMKWKQINDVVIFVHKSIQPISINFFGKDLNDEYVFKTSVVEFSEIPYFTIGSTNDYSGPLKADGISGKVTLTTNLSDSTIKAYLPRPMNTMSTYTRSKRFDMVLSNMLCGAANSTIRLIRRRDGTENTLCSGVCNVVTQTDYTTTDTITREAILRVVQTKYPSSYLNDAEIILSGVSDHQDGDSYYMSLTIGIINVAGGSVIYPSEFYSSEPFTPASSNAPKLDKKDWVGRKIKFFMSPDVETLPWWQGRRVSKGDYAYSNGHWYKADNSDECGNIQPSHTVGIRSDGNVSWVYVHSGSNTATIIDVPKDNEVVVLVNNGELPANNYEGSYLFENYSFSIWGKNGVHPSEIYMVGNRLGFVCNTNGYGAWNSLSVVDDYFNFSTEEFGQQRDTSAIVNVIPNNESGEINWVLSRKSVYMGSYSGEYHIKSSNGILTPTTAQVDNISNIGGEPVMPLKYNELNMFVGATGKELYTIGYDYTIDDYTPRSLGVMTEHLMDKSIRRLDALNNKDRNIYILHESNEISIFHYVKEQRILGFSQVDLAAPVLDFVTTYSKNIVTAYVAVKRNDNKVTLERFASDEPVYMFNAVTVSADSNKRAPAIPMFANKEVWVRFGEGLSQFKKVVLDSDGNSDAIPESENYKIGLPMVCQLHTQPAFGNKVEGAQQQSISVYLRLKDSGSFEYGSSVDFDKYFPFDSWPSRQEYDSGRMLYTGDCELNIPLGYAHASNQGSGPYPNTSSVGINIKSDAPEPLNLLSIQEIYK